MKIKKIEITNYKAFLGTHTIDVGGNNLFIYGENGSGKSSLYYALKDFFQSASEDIDFDAVENIFTPQEKQGESAIKVVFKPRSDGRQSLQKLKVTASEGKNTDSEEAILQAQKLRSFLTYKTLLDIHHIEKDGEINLFDLLVIGVLRHFTNPTISTTIGELWKEVQEIVARERSTAYNRATKKRELDTAISAFNSGFGQLFEEDNPDYILKNANEYLQYFDKNIEIRLSFTDIYPSENLDTIGGDHVGITIHYAGKRVAKPHIFLNEARLSAIALSIYLGMIKRHPQGMKYKILFLDDVFIGLDISNRLPLLEILEEHFQEYQIFTTTYDKPWYEYAKGYIGEGWKCIEFYAQETKDGYEIPAINDDTEAIIRAKKHLDASDYKASAVYTRTAFEKILKNYCNDKSIKVPFKIKQKTYTTQDFWDEIVRTRVLSAEIVRKVETYRSLVLNSFCHYDTEVHEIKRELHSAIETIKELKEELR